MVNNNKSWFGMEYLSLNNKCSKCNNNNRVNKRKLNKDKVKVQVNFKDFYNNRLWYLKINYNKVNNNSLNNSLR